MGQTLTHGIYLPDEGERNCYAGLAANWQLLDGAVGTVAEHTSQIAGKAPAVHTHTKADITDLLNSNFIPSANNSYDLGSSSYQWNNLYAKNYYYNGVAWGLDKANEWTAENTYNTINLKYYLSGQHADLYWKDENNATISAFRHNAQSITLGKRYTGKTAWYQGAQIAINQNGTIELKSYDGTNNHSIVLNSQSLYPVTTSDLDLGTSTNKWKSLNGVNPGALSLPDYNNVLDVTSEIPVASLDGNTQININDYLPNKTGWLSIVIDDTAGNSIIATQGRSGGSTAYNNSRTFHTGAQSNGFISVFFPILADMNKFVSIKASSLIQMRFYYCLGNV